MKDDVKNMIFEKAKKNESFPDKFFPVMTDDMFIDMADDSENYKNLGVKKGTLLFFERNKPFQEGCPSIFINTATGETIVMNFSKTGYKYAGLLIATLMLNRE